MVGFVVMGVAGCGKTSVGEGVSRLTGVPFVDGDDLHPEANIAKMSAGTPLTDEDREPWLRDVGKAIAKNTGDIIIGCSALKRSYRDLIREEAGVPVLFIHLHTQKSVIARRMQAREGHFMPTALLDSQFEVLEPLQANEKGHVVEIASQLETVINNAASYVRDVAG